MMIYDGDKVVDDGLVVDEAREKRVRETREKERIRRCEWDKFDDDEIEVKGSVVCHEQSQDLLHLVVIVSSSIMISSGVIILSLTSIAMCGHHLCLS
ncbi:hypothetical protein RJT34_16506 [Clitoria ternatea]|uniref:Transmembrane protein n=1 Tax=Clitoria ternatea TaxID=43366 RepID=A0AAN9JAC6_CLITE